MNPREKSFEDLAARIDDGRPIDWELEARQAASEADRELVQALRTLYEVATGFRGPRAPEPDRAPDAGVRWGELTVFEAVGHGAFGTVHRALDFLHRTVALKLLDQSPDVVAMKSRILEEARLLARVRHQNIAVVHGAGEADGRVGLWMEFIDGVTLAAEVEARGPMSAEEAATIGRKLCGALVAIHGAGCVHGDLKAQNVMRERGGRIVLMDFGACQALGETQAARLAGTPLYLAPERLAGAPATPSCDLYALGVLLYFLATRAYPVEGDSREDVERAHAAQRRVRLRDRRSDLPDAFVAAVEDALAPDPRARHETAGAFDEALTRVTNARDGSGAGSGSGSGSGGRPSAGGGTPHGDAPAGPGRFRRWLLPGAIAATVAGSALTLLWVTREPERTPEQAARGLVSVRPPSNDYTVQAAFFRVGERGREATAAGMRIGRGDRLELDIRLSRDAAVYVVNEDDRGNAFLLFPLADGNLRNPLRGQQTHTLPGPSGAEPMQWEIDSVGGRERFYVIVAPGAVPSIQAAIDRLTPASNNPAAALTARADSVPKGFRGAGKLARGQAALAAAHAPWRELARPLSQEPEKAQGLWVRELTFENPGATRP